MRKTIAALLCAAAGLTGVGCNSLKYEERTPDGGVISFKMGERDQALAQLKKDYGDVAIEAEYDPKSVNGNKLFDPNAPMSPSERVVASGPLGTMFASTDDGKMHIKFSKAGGPGTTPAGLPPVPREEGVTQAGFKQPQSVGSTLPPPNMSGTAGTN